MFAPAFIVVAVISAVSAYFFWQMPDDAGHEISGPQGGRDLQPQGRGRRPRQEAAASETADARDQRLG